jgi:PAS domain S-box-containing protein
MKDQSKTKQPLIQKKASLDKASEYAESIIDTVREPLIILDQDLRVVTASRSFYEFFKVKPEETEGQLIYNLGNDQWDIPKLRELLETILPQKTTFDNYEVEHDFVTIGRRVMLLNARQIKRALGKERIILLAIEDITKRKQLESLLIDSEERYRHLFETASDGIVFLEQREGMITHANPASEKILGYTKKELIGNKLQDIGILLDMGNFQATMQDLEKSGIIHYNDVPVKTKSGQQIDTDIYLVDRATLVQCSIRDVTERKRAEEELRKSEEKYRLVFEYSPLGLLSFDEKGIIVACNNNFVKIIGSSREKLIGLNMLKLPNENIVSAVQKALNGSLGLYEGEYSSVTSRKITQVRCLFEPMNVGGGRIPGGMGIIEDITERKKSEEKLLESEERYKALYDRSLNLIYTIDFDGRFIDANDAALNLFGYKREEIRSLNIVSLMNEDQLPLALKVMQEIMETGTQKDLIEFRLRRKDGSDIYVDSQGSAVISNGKPIAIQAVARDVTERKRSEESLRQSEEKYRTILEDIQEGYFEVDFAGNFTFFNDSLSRYFGYSKEELMGMNYRQYTEKEHSKELFQTFNKVYSTGEPTEGFDWQIIKKDGTKRNVETSVLLQKDSSGKPIGFRGIARDVTERKQVEEALRQEQQFSKVVLDNLPGVFYLYTYPENRMVLWNKQGEEILGFNAEELKGRHVTEWLPPEYREAVLKTIDEVMEKGQSSIEAPLMAKDGHQIPFFLTGVRFDVHGQLYFMGIGTDITERKKAEEELRESEERYRIIAENTADTIAIFDLNFNPTYISPSILKLRGYPAQEAMTLTLDQTLTPDSLQQASKMFADQMALESSGTADPARTALIDLEEYCKDGSTIWVELAASFLRDNNFKPTGMLTVTRNITERKRAEAKLQQTLESLKKAVGATIQVMVSAVEMRDPYTAGHQHRSADLARAIAKEMGLPQDKIDGIRLAGSIHDIGKLSIPAEILSKPTKLTNLEFSLIKEHSLSGYEMLKNVESPWPLAQIVYQHHERMDGSGYPQGLKGDEILMEARIMAVADVVESMASHRPYRPALGIEAALEEIEKNKGILYDADAVNACLRLFREKSYQLK